MLMKKRLLLSALGLAWLLLTVPLMAALAQDDLTCEDLAPAGVDAPYFVGVGDAYFESGSYAVAIVAYTCALERDPDYAPAYVNRGFAHAAQRNDPLATDDYNRALELDETLVPAYNNRGLLYTTQGNFGLAITDFTLALTLAPDDPVAYHNRGVVHAIEGSYDLALEDLQQAAALDAGYAAPHAALGAVYSALAAQSYRQFAEIAGETARPPAGEPDDVLNALDESLESGSFAVWLPLLTPARR